MDDFNESAKGKYDSGDKQVNQAIRLLEEEGFTYKHEAMPEYGVRAILMKNEDAGEAAVILMSAIGYPVLAEDGTFLESPQLLRGPEFAFEMPAPVRVSTYIAQRLGGGAKPGAAPKP
jgi:hypothetical protein